jgi:hypothetical protein
MTREQLARWWTEQVGYDPLAEKPDQPTEELRRDCVDYHTELVLASMVDDPPEGDEP